MLRVLVTSIGGEIGFSIARILHQEYKDLFLLGCDVKDDNIGQVLCDEVIISPYADTKDYKNFILNTIKKYNIDIVIPVSDLEVKTFWKDNLMQDKIIASKTIIVDKNTVELSMDKFHTINFLKKHHLPFPETILANQTDLTQINYPVIIKPRFGQGSKNIKEVYFKDEFPKNCLNNEYIIQELLSTTQKEYTCCVFSNNQKIRNIIMKRTLVCGRTGYGEVVENEEIKQYVLDISKKLHLKGSINLQLRVTNRGPVLFEINPRFSSTVMFREKLGFRDLIWSIQEKMGEDLHDYICNNSGIKFFRDSQEYLV